MCTAANVAGSLIRSAQSARTLSSEVVDRIRSSGKLGVMLGSHHGDVFRSPDDVRYFVELGLRCCILVTFGLCIIAAITVARLLERSRRPTLVATALIALGIIESAAPVP